MTLLQSLLVAAAIALPFATSSPCHAVSTTPAATPINNPISTPTATPRDCDRPEITAFIRYCIYTVGVFDPFCSWYLSFPNPTATVSTTDTYVIEEASYIFTTEGTDTILTRVFATASELETWVRSFTVDVYPDLQKREAEATPEVTPEVTPTPESTLRDIDIFETVFKPDENGSIFGFAPAVVTDACECFADRPPATQTDISYILTTTTIPFTETIASETVTSTSTDTIVSYMTISDIHTNTLSSNPTDCGTPASPTFFVQLRDADPERTDEWNDNYLAIMDGRWRGIEDSLDAGVVPNPSKRRALLLTIEPGTGYLKSAVDGRYLNTDYFNDLQLMYFTGKVSIDVRQFHYHVCSIVPRGDERELVCTVPQSAWKLDTYQTCPIYFEFYGLPIAAGAELSPKCFQKRFWIVDACV
ncbi:hypothetical protein B0J13DRAFT_628381 [Dactylonectria estremocensis]|uniref:Uncharacterized protein n=1 Tax=Dactylonectria estremocensis TaxID=1079267 RepID=A0A9P9DQL5_9HYPO|nr:hypothetical protein B0J13DRAFT_628381 [Dactylonectria estremocensis]